MTRWGSIRSCAFTRGLSSGRASLDEVLGRFGDDGLGDLAGSLGAGPERSHLGVGDAHDVALARVGSGGAGLVALDGVRPDGVDLVADRLGRLVLLEPLLLDQRLARRVRVAARDLEALSLGAADDGQDGERRLGRLAAAPDAGVADA